MNQQSNYYDLTGYINSSSMASLMPEEGGSPKRFQATINGRLKKESSGFKFGTLAHLYILEPEKFVVSDFEPPTGWVAKFMEDIFNGHQDISPKDFEDNIKLYAQQAVDDKLDGRIKNPETMAKKLLTEGKVYLEHLITGSQRLIISSKDQQRILECKDNILPNSLVEKELKLKNSEQLRVFNELECFFEYRGHACKAKLDKLVVNLQEGWFYLSDVKTTGKSIEEFPKNAMRYLYPRQIKFYEMAAIAFLKKQYPQQRFTPKTHRFILFESNALYESDVFYISEEVMEFGALKVKQFFELYEFHQRYGWEIPKHVQDNGFERFLCLPKHLKNNLHEPAIHIEVAKQNTAPSTKLHETFPGI